MAAPASRPKWPATLILLAALSLLPAARAQNAATYSGRPFLRIAQANLSDPVAGFYSGFGRSQIVGDAVILATLSGPNVGGIYSGRGGTLSRVATPGLPLSGVTLQVFHSGFARDTGSGQVALAAGTTLADAIQLTDGATLTTLLASGTILPGSGGKVANAIGEPFYAKGELAVIAWHALPNGGGVDFRGVYRVKNGALETVANTATALPGVVGTPDTFSSQVGFDGEVLAFWATRGPFAANEGMFVQASGGTPVKIAQNGDAFPGGGTIDGFVSPPFVAQGAVYFYAFDSASRTRLLKYQNGTITTLAQDGDVAPGGSPLRGLGQFGLAAENGKAFFPALTDRGAGLYVVDGGGLQTVIAPGTTVAGLPPATLVLQDVADDTIVVEVINGANRRLAANLARPSVPVIVSNPTNQTAKAGARVEFNVTALGEGPLTYIWNFAGTNLPGVTGNTLVLTNVDAAAVGFYRVSVTNAFGQVTSTSAQLNVEVPPVLLSMPANTTVEAGDQLILRVGATGGLPLSYTWLKDGLAVTNETAGLGLFARVTAQIADAGRYSVTVSNAFGTVTSTEAIVTITPSAPNPSYGGGRFIAAVDVNSTVPGGSAKFDTASFAENSARWAGGRVVFTGQDTTGLPLGVFAFENNALARLLAPDAPLANGLGAANGFSLAFALPGEALVVRGQQMIGGFRQPVGIYSFATPNLNVIADITMAAPEANGTKFPIFFGDSYHAAGKTAFIATVTNIPALYLAEKGGLRRVLSAKENLPVNGTATTQLQSVSFDGTNMVVVATTAAQQQLVALHLNATGVVTKLLAKDDPMPGGAGNVRSLGPTATDGQAFYLTAYDGSFAPNFLAWGEGKLTRVAGPGMTVTGLGNIQSIETSYPKAAAGKVYFSARVTTSQGVRQGILVANVEGIKPVLFVSKLDARQVTGTYLIDVEGEKVIALIQFLTGTRALYANVGQAETPPLQLTFSRPTATTLRLAIPEGATLEVTPALGSPWQPATDTEVSITTGNRFYRLRRP